MKDYTTITLELNKKLSKKAVMSFNDLPEGLDINLMDLFSITIENVPNKVEYELSKLIFNRVEIEQLKQENIIYSSQVANHLSYHTPSSVK